LPRSSTTQRVPSPTREVPLGTPRIATRAAPRVLSGPPPHDRRVEGSAPPTRFLNRLVGSPRALIAALVLLALLPNLTVAAFVWLPALWTPEAKVEEPVRADATGAPDTRPKETAKLAPALTVPSILEANAGEDVVLPIALDGTDGVPFRSAVAISGLPAGATLSGGRPYGASGWNLKPDEIGDLHLVLPDAAKGETRLAIHLVDSAGEIVAAAETTLRVAAKPEPALSAPPPNNDPNPVSTEAQAERTPQGAAMNTDGKPDGPQALNAVDEDPAPSAANDSLKRSNPGKNADPAKLAPSDGVQREKDGAGANSVQPSTSVNLREGPTSAAAVIGVIAKDTKLKVLEQKRRWVKVINPETSESGWIYAPNLDGLPKSRDWSGQASRAEEPSQPHESIWKRMGHWLTGG
jgi:Bacterial SH3 domain